MYDSHRKRPYTLLGIRKCENCSRLVYLLLSPKCVCGHKSLHYWTTSYQACRDNAHSCLYNYVSKCVCSLGYGTVHYRSKLCWCSTILHWHSKKECCFVRLYKGNIIIEIKNHSDHIIPFQKGYWNLEGSNHSVPKSNWVGMERSLPITRKNSSYYVCKTVSLDFKQKLATPTYCI